VRRLTRALRARLARAPGERGAIAIAVALFMPILFGLCAIAIDTTAVWSARQQVETGADAAVLAVAMDCANGDCGDIKSTAEAAFWANDKAGKVADLGPGEGWIAVNGRHISATQKTPWLIKHYFAAALGYDTGSLSVSSYAQWAPMTRGVSLAPIAMAWCDYRAKTGTLGSNTPTTISVKDSVGGSCTMPDGSSGGGGGTGLTDTDHGNDCQTTSSLAGTVKRYKPVVAGRLPGGCSDAYFATLVGTTVLVPIWDDVADKSYSLYGYAAFHVTSYDGSSNPAFSGYFTYYAHQVDDTTPPATTAPDLGARSVFLTTN